MKELDTYTEKVIDESVKFYLANEMRENRITKEQFIDNYHGLKGGNDFFNLFPYQQFAYIDSTMLMREDLIPESYRDSAILDSKKRCLDHFAKEDTVINRVIAGELGFQGSIANIESEYWKIFKKGRIIFNPKKVKTDATEMGEFISRASYSMNALTGDSEWKYSTEHIENILKRKDSNSTGMIFFSIATTALSLGGIYSAVGISRFIGDMKNRKREINEFFDYFQDIAKKSDNLIKSIYASPEEIEMDKNAIKEEEKRIKIDLADIMGDLE